MIRFIQGTDMGYRTKDGRQVWQVLLSSDENPIYMPYTGQDVVGLSPEGMMPDSIQIGPMSVLVDLYNSRLYVMDNDLDQQTWMPWDPGNGGNGGA